MITINPGSDYAVMDSEDHTGVYGIFIASDRDAIVQKGWRNHSGSIFISVCRPCLGRRSDQSDGYSDEVSEVSTLPDPLGRFRNASYKGGIVGNDHRRVDNLWTIHM